ncbi:putative DNA-binding protein [Escherichia coli]|uniref:Putative DNA-binding protein n=1 Tax=Escherichia coli TaxID=562 RepID=A0A377DBU4_ECOLX|nr:putative DNA-binding protein [Escherichia coli]
MLADAFHAQAAALVQGAGTGAIRAALAALLKPGQRLLVHDAPVYPTTQVIIEQMGLTLITADFNDLLALKQVVDEQQQMPCWCSIRASSRRTGTFWQMCWQRCARLAFLH